MAGNIPGIIRDIIFAAFPIVEDIVNFQQCLADAGNIITPVELGQCLQDFFQELGNNLPHSFWG